jgi:hypothetical protein
MLITSYFLLLSDYCTHYREEKTESQVFPLLQYNAMKRNWESGGRDPHILNLGSRLYASVQIRASDILSSKEESVWTQREREHLCFY